MPRAAYRARSGPHRPNVRGARSHRPVGAIAALSAVGSLALCGCSSVSPSATQGSSRQVCGQTISAANAGPNPWFVDLTSDPATDTIEVTHQHPVWVRLSTDCSAGVAAPVIGNSEVAEIDASVAASAASTGVVAVQIIAVGDGTTSLERADASARDVSVHVAG